MDVRFLSPGSRVDLRGGGEVWMGSSAFSRGDLTMTVMSSRERRGFVSIARAGAAIGSTALPAALWFAGDTGQARDTLLRAHPLIDDGRLRIEQLGRQLVHASIEGQRWWTRGLLRAGAAAFVDTARTGEGVSDGSRGDVDAGVGLRLALPGLSGLVRADIATGLRHGGTRWSFVYEPGR
jgi:hypothetical protein